MCNQPGRFYGELKIPRASVIPFLQRLRFRKPVKGNVQLYGLEKLTIVFKPFSLGELRGIKLFSPGFIVKSRTTDPPFFHKQPSTGHKQEKTGAV
jgi:hypothetical protein